MKKSRLKRGQSTVVAEILLLVMVLILSSTVVLTMRSNMSYYTQRRELVSIYLWTSQNDTEMNFTAIHCGVDTVKVHGQILFTDSNGAEKLVTADIFYNNTLSPVSLDGAFELSQFKFGENATVIVDLNGLGNGTLHYVLSSRSQILAKVDVEP